jgi:hypothetical protein
MDAFIRREFDKPSLKGKTLEDICAISYEVLDAQREMSKAKYQYMKTVKAEFDAQKNLDAHPELNIHNQPRDEKKDAEFAAMFMPKR